MQIIFCHSSLQTFSFIKFNKVHLKYISANNFCWKSFNECTFHFIQGNYFSLTKTHLPTSKRNPLVSFSRKNLLTGSYHNQRTIKPDRIVLVNNVAGAYIQGHMPGIFTALKTPSQETSIKYNPHKTNGITHSLYS